MNVIGVVGPFGSGCTYVTKKISENKKYNYKRISLSDELKELYRADYPKKTPKREDLQKYGDKLRHEKGNNYLASLVAKIIDQDQTINYVVDSIRNPAEIDFFRKKYSGFFLFGVFAEKENRWKRVKHVYDGNQLAFEEDDKRDSDEKLAYGQKVTASFRMADIIILNNNNIVKGNSNEEDFISNLSQKIDLIEKTIPFRPNYLETNMAMAYAVSMRSSCLKRKVGAVIVDPTGDVFSSGYNEVPAANNSCKSEYGTCYRDKLKDDYKISLEKAVKTKSQREKAYEIFKKNFKILDYCRALHAEENAILNVARVGASAALSSSTLFTSTYPCNLCANKIAQVGIKHIVYFEPYPMDEAKKILTEKGVEQQPFEGVTYNGYFRLMEVVD